MRFVGWALALMLCGTALLGQSTSPSSSDSVETIFEIESTPSLSIERSLPKKDAKPKERFHWGAALIQQLEFTSIQHAGNIAMDKWKRYYVIQGPFWSNYVKSIEKYRWSVWNDNDPFLDDYIAHPMQGAIYGYIEIQNDPQGRELRLERSRRYVMSRLRAFAWSAAWSAQWKVGPLSEASIGNSGMYPYYSTASHGITNGTGVVDLVMTPVGGMAWLIGEDAIDKYIVQPITANHRHVPLLFALSILTPCRSAANILRFHSPWYRDRSPESVIAKQEPRLKVKILVEEKGTSEASRN